jgi:predicted negative regulator of RcsB-dependent stress response
LDVDGGLFLPSQIQIIFFVNTKHLNTILYCVVFLLAVSCSTQKDGFAYRVYHNTTTHYNGYFNADQSIQKGYGKILAAEKPDYDNILPIFIIGTKETAQASFPEMERAIEKSEKMINRHTIKKEANKDKKRPEFNKWIDENYMVIGRSHFYKRNYVKSEQVFKYVNGKYQDENTQIASATWLARAYTEMGEYSKALVSLNRSEPKEEHDPKLVAEYYMAMADILLRQEKYAEAAVKMESSLKHIKKKKDRARPHFIIAQIYQKMNKSAEALTHYESVLKSRPPYELEFYSKINKALSYSRRGGSSEDIKKELMKMLRDEKNENYKDQIYFALGDLALEEQNRPQAIYYFEESIKNNQGNQKQRAKAFLKLADLYFNERKYEDAQIKYDSTAAYIDATHPRYREIKARAENLAELVGYLNTIALNDSVNKLCDMSEKDLERSLQKAQKDAQRKADELRRRDEEEAAKAAAGQASGISGTFWAYNENLREKGQTNFKDYWGERPLKDNWRLQSKVATMYNDPDESIVVVAEAGKPAELPEERYKVPTLEELRATLPCGDAEKVKQSRSNLAEAYYKSGVIYKEKLDDADNATDIWEQQILNMDESDFHPMTLYQLYRTWLYKEQLAGYKANPFCETCSSVYWANEVKNRYPDSEWSRLIDNPEYLDQREVKDKEETAAYEEVYKIYVRGSYVEAMGACNKVIQEEPENHLICKYKLLRAVCIGYSDGAVGVRDNFIKELNDVKANCPNTEEATQAGEILKSLNKELAPQNPQNNDGVAPPDQGDEAPKESVFKFDNTGEHYMAVIVPVKDFNMNNFKVKLTDYNTLNFSTSGYKVTNNLLDKERHIVMVKPFQGADAAKDYMGYFKADEGLKALLDGKEVEVFVISKSNYIALFKSKDLAGYIQFYNENY